MNLQYQLDLSLVIPCYNEEKKISGTLDSVVIYLQGKPWKSEIIIANDGSTDKTIEIVSKYQIKTENLDIRVVEHFPNRGRGAILTKAFEKVRGNAVIYMDADLATELNCLDHLILELENSHVVTGSRLLEDSITTRPLSRTILSKGYNFLVRFFLHDGIQDHQCGFKGFRKAIITSLISKVESEGWFWDTEVLVLAKYSNLAVKEIPIKWSESREKGDSKVKIGKTIKDYLIQIIWLRRKINTMKKINSRE